MNDEERMYRDAMERQGRRTMWRYGLAVAALIIGGIALTYLLFGWGPPPIPG